MLQLTNVGHKQILPAGVSTMNNQDNTINLDSAYEPPAIEILGTVHDITQGREGNSNDGGSYGSM